MALWRKSGGLILNGILSNGLLVVDFGLSYLKLILCTNRNLFFYFPLFGKFVYRTVGEATLHMCNGGGFLHPHLKFSVHVGILLLFFCW